MSQSQIITSESETLVAEGVTELPPPFPNHNQLPSEDDTFVNNFQKHPQSIILTDSIGPILEKIHPDGDYVIGQNCGIYWRATDPPEQGAEAPDWFYIPNVPPLLDGEIRHFYVLWREFFSPFIALEFASGSGKEERDTTSLWESEKKEKTRPGKFWVYEWVLRIPYYGIYDITLGKLEVYNLVNRTYRKLEPNERGNYLIERLQVELGLWQGNYQNQNQLWLRWWDRDGNLLLTGSERADRLAREKIDAVGRLQQLGLNIEQIASALSLSVEEVDEQLNQEI